MFKMSTDKITIENNGIVQTRQIITDEDGTTSFHRMTFLPGQDVSEQPQDIQDACKKAWTQEVLAAYKKEWDAIVAEANKFTKVT
jgi:hypothetical protein